MKRIGLPKEVYYLMDNQVYCDNVKKYTTPDNSSKIDFSIKSAC